MARPLRMELAGGVYHVTARGNDRCNLYRDPTDRRGFLELFAEVISRHRWFCHAYCLMGNHYHLLVEITDTNLKDGIQLLNGVYTQRFNRRHRRVGHLFQGRYHAPLVDRETYLLELCRYVVLNPVRSGFVSSPERYPWSSYRATVGLATPLAFLTTDWILSQFATERTLAQERYARFVRDGIGAESPWRGLKHGILLGDEAFVSRLARHLPGRDRRALEVPKAQRLLGRPTLERLLDGAARSTKRERDRTIRAAHVEHGYTLAQIARHLGLHYSTVSRAFKRAGQESE